MEVNKVSRFSISFNIFNMGLHCRLQLENQNEGEQPPSAVGTAVDQGHQQCLASLPL